MSHRSKVFTFLEVDDKTNKRDGDIALMCLAADSTLRMYSMESFGQGKLPIQRDGWDLFHHLHLRDVFDTFYFFKELAKVLHYLPSL
jgi:hypothetical protein